MEKSKLKQNCRHLLILDEFISLKEAESVSNTLEELLAFTAHASESAASFTMDLDTEIYRFKCNQCKYQAKYQKYLQQHMQSKHMGIRQERNSKQTPKYCCDQCDNDTDKSKHTDSKRG